MIEENIQHLPLTKHTCANKHIHKCITYIYTHIHHTHAPTQRNMVGIWWCSLVVEH